jgi:hypothetical protein
MKILIKSIIDYFLTSKNSKSRGMERPYPITPGKSKVGFGVAILRIRY